jgi:acyl-CoA synthetase (AMP-forming)/AMP-acid ligase II
MAPAANAYRDRHRNTQHTTQAAAASSSSSSELARGKRYGTMSNSAILFLVPLLGCLMPSHAPLHLAFLLLSVLFIVK